jgi:hypothetical protein
MNIQDAAKLLELEGTITPSIVKESYRRAAKTYHPDINPSGAKMMQLINAAYEILKDFEGNVEIELGSTSYPKALNEALNKIIDITNINIEICGAWVWVTGSTKPHSQTLGKQGAGFTYASKKKAWYFRPAGWKSKSRGKLSLSEIRSKYGSQSVRKTERESIEARA